MRGERCAGKHVSRPKPNKKKSPQLRKIGFRWRIPMIKETVEIKAVSVDEGWFGSL